MKSVFNLAAGLLALDGLLHFVKIAVLGIDPMGALPAVVTGLFGVAYLVVAYFLYRQRDPAVAWGLFLPIIGLVLTLVGLKSSPDAYTLVIIILDVLVIGVCGYLFFTGRGVIRRVR